MNLECTNDSQHLFFGAVKTNDIKSVVKLLKNPDINPNLFNQQGTLNYTITEGFLEITKILLSDDRIDPNYSFKKDTHPITTAAWKGYLDIAKLLLKHKKTILSNNHHRSITAIANAAYYGDLKIKFNLDIASGDGRVRA